MHVFLRRAGKVIGSFDRLDYLAQLDQGGITPDDEWTPVGEGAEYGVRPLLLGH